MVEIYGACGDDFGELIALFQRGHHPPWELRREAQGEMTDWGDPGWPKRAYWQEVPYSLMYPDSEPCNGEEAILFEKCAKDAVGAFPVTVLYVNGESTP